MSPRNDIPAIANPTARPLRALATSTIKIKASSGLSEAEIQNMVKDAESHAEDDRKQLEVVQARNQLDTLVHSVKKSIGEYGDKVGADEKAKIESAVKDAETLLKKDDATKEALEAQSESLGKAAQKLGEIMYAEAQAKSEPAGAGPGGGSAGGGAAGGEAGKKEETVVDAEYTEVKDKQ